ncbi:OpgC domain-containing protein [Paraburkholderia sp. A1RI_3L]|uniref:OpgC domain-containing protein n=1 Tax=Paraburkholderia TaxID=1822464 RepID=UPI003B7B743B
MQASASSRLVELDFFRGLVLLVIVVDHIGGSILSRFTLHAYALCDAAEVFVFLGGYATAVAYGALVARHTESAARQRFLRRAFEIYRAFLVTAALMLVVSAVMLMRGIDAPNVTTADIEELAATPLSALADILLMRRQPYLAGVLPMYALFALAVPAMLPLARRRPVVLLVGSIVLWAAAPYAADWLPHAEDVQWDFNPLAWQLLFVLGVLAKCQPIYQRVSAHRLGWLVTVAAGVAFVVAAWYRLGVETAPPDGSFKQNLAWFRLGNFIAIAWLAAGLVEAGWVRKVARALPWIGLVGRKGLLCFVCGTAISLVVDSLLFKLTEGYLNYPLGLAADAIAIGTLLLVAKSSEPITRVLTVRVKTTA